MVLVAFAEMPQFMWRKWAFLEPTCSFFWQNYASNKPKEQFLPKLSRKHTICYLFRAKFPFKTSTKGYNDAMVAHDENIGRMLDKLDELGITDDTIVMYSTDNGPHYNTWPDAGITPFRSEKNTNWEGGWRVPAFVRWPGKFKQDRCLMGSSACKNGYLHF